MKRICKKCGIEKDIEEFVKSTSCLHGRRYICKKCHNKEKPEISEEQIIERRIKIKEYRYKNPDKIKKQRKEQYQKHKEKELKRQREYNKEQYEIKTLYTVQENKRKCSHCGVEKKLNEFTESRDCHYGISYICLECTKESSFIYREERKEEINLKIKEYYEKYPEKIKEKNENRKEKYKNDIDLQEKIKTQTKEYYKDHKEEKLIYNKEYRSQNKIKLNEKDKLRQREYLKIPQNAIKAKLRGRINCALQGIKKAEHTMELLGCSINFFMNYLQSTAIQNGYTDFDINDYSGREYHIDHIIPCDAFRLECKWHQKLCFFYKNFQILRASENISKNSTVDFTLVEEFQDYKEANVLSCKPSFSLSKSPKISFKDYQMKSEEFPACEILQFIRACDSNISQATEHLEEIASMRKVA